jgi:hypothetical protein
MKQQPLSSLVGELARAGRIAAEDVLRLRRNIYGGRTITEAQIDALLSLTTLALTKPQSGPTCSRKRLQTTSLSRGSHAGTWTRLMRIG